MLCKLNKALNCHPRRTRTDWRHTLRATWTPTTSVSPACSGWFPMVESTAMYTAQLVGFDLLLTSLPSLMLQQLYVWKLWTRGFPTTDSGEPGLMSLGLKIPSCHAQCQESVSSGSVWISWKPYLAQCPGMALLEAPLRTSA